MAGLARRVSLLMVVGLGILSLGACTGPATDHTLKLGQGEVNESFEFTAEVPTTHAFDVDIEMPASTDLEVLFRTADGATLRILNSSMYESSCADAGDLVTCHLSFPILEARAPGTWAAEVRKRSTPEAEVTISIEWLSIEQND